MAKKKRESKEPLTPNQQLWLKEFKALKRRARRWEIEKGLLFTDFPEMPKRVHQKDIENIKAIQLKNINEEDRYRYQYFYHSKYTSYTPMTEEQYINGEADKPYNPTNTLAFQPKIKSPTIDDDEMRSFIEETIEKICNPSVVEGEKNIDAENIIRGLLDDARFAMGERAFYRYLQNEETVNKLQKSAYGYMYASDGPKGGAEAQASLFQFTTTLNMGHPLDRSQMDDLEETFRVRFDYTYFDEYEDFDHD